MKQRLTLILSFALVCCLQQVYAQSTNTTTLELSNLIRAGDLTTFQERYSVNAVIGIDPVSKIRPLHLACKLGKKEFVDFLLKKESRMETGVYVTRDEITPMVHAMKEGHTDIIQSLINIGKRRAKDGWKNKSYLEYAIEYRCKAEVFQKLAENGANIDQLVNEKTLLYHAAEKGDTEIVEILTAIGANPNKICIDYSPLGIATKKGHIQAIQKMAVNGLNLNQIASSTKEDIRTIAIQNNRHDILDLTQSQQRTSSDNKDHSDIELAAKFKKWDLVKVENSAKLIDEGTKTIFMAAVEANDIEFTKELLSNDADVNLKTKAYTPLTIASKAKNIEMAKLLIREGAKINVETEEGTPLEAAIWNNDVKMVQLLVNNGANLEHRNKWNQTPLRYAKRYKRSLEVIKVLETALAR